MMAEMGTETMPSCLCCTVIRDCRWPRQGTARNLLLWSFKASACAVVCLVCCIGWACTVPSKILRTCSSSSAVIPVIAEDSFYVCSFFIGSLIGAVTPLR